MDEQAAVLGRVLVVDDDRSLLSIIDGVLSDEYAVSLASSAEEAFEITANTSVDLILMDVMMPGLSGIQACIGLKADPATADIPVIFLTGVEDDDVEEACLDAGGADFISKPIRPRILQARVRLQMQNFLYLQFMEKMLREKSTTVERLRAETKALLTSIGLSSQQ